MAAASSVHGFSASYVALRNKAEIQLAIGLLRRYSPVVEYFTLQSLLQENIQPDCTFRRQNASEFRFIVARLVVHSRYYKKSFNSLYL